MTVMSSTADRENLKMTVVAEFNSPAEKVWEVWADPRKLEKWWGPPTWPATFTEYEFEEGGTARYHMTGTEGEKAPGFWRFELIEAKRQIRFLDGFAREDGEIDENMPTMVMEMTLEGNGDHTTMTTVTTFNSLEDLEQLLEMGMEEGIREAMGQIDALL